VQPGSNIGALDQNYQPPAVHDPGLRCRPLVERPAAWATARSEW